MVFASLGQQFCFLRWQGWPGFQYFPSKIEYFLKLCIGLWHLRTRENQCEPEARISCTVNNDVLCLFPGVVNHLLVSLKLWLTNLLFYTEGTISDPSQVQHASPFDHLGQTAIVLINQNYQMKFWISSWASVENGAHCPPGCSKPSCQSKQTWGKPRPLTFKHTVRHANSSLMWSGCFQMKRFGTKLAERTALSKAVKGIWPLRLLIGSSESLDITGLPGVSSLCEPLYKITALYDFGN